MEFCRVELVATRYCIDEPEGQTSNHESVDGLPGCFRFQPNPKRLQAVLPVVSTAFLARLLPERNREIPTAVDNILPNTPTRELCTLHSVGLLTVVLKLVLVPEFDEIS